MGIAERWRRSAPLPDDLDAALAALKPLFEAEGVELAYLFGSLATGEHPPNDVDLAVLLPAGASLDLRAAIVRGLGTDRLDLVDLHTASPRLRFEILRSGKLLHARDPGVLERFELQTLRQYRDTAPLRERQRAYLRQTMAEWSSDEKRSKSD